MKTILSLIFMSLMSATIECNWTYQYKKIFSANECGQNNSKNAIQFIKEDVPQFSQMILSWNARRPAKGYFIFWGQVRDATKKWHDWHKMCQWGFDMQRSFFSEGSTINHHVRLEIPQEMADSLRVKVTAHDGATLKDLHALFVCISDFSKFKSESIASLAALEPIEINNIPKFSQMELNHEKKEVLCSPTSCSMVTSYFMGKLINPVNFASRCYDDGLNAYGSWPYNVAHAYECCDESIFFSVARLNSFKELHRYLCKKIPVIVSVRGQLDGAPQEYKQGHLLVVIGWDPATKKVICHDPAFANNHQTRVGYNANSFLQAWERSRRLAYIAQPISQYYK